MRLLQMPGEMVLDVAGALGCALLGGQGQGYRRHGLRHLPLERAVGEVGKGPA